MRAFYQGVAFGDVNCAKFSWGRTAIVGGDRRVNGYQNRADFGEIGFAVSGQADCATKMAAIETAFALPYGDLLVKNDDASNSVNSVLSSGTVDGVKPMSLTWSDEAGAQFWTFRKFSAAFQWETRLAGLAGTFLTEFSETVTVQGGTPRTVVQPPINVAVSAADEFVTLPKQAYVITQRGRAVGLTAYPVVATIAPPLYANPNTNPITKTSPMKAGATYFGYAVEWEYSWNFGTLASLPIPNLWP